MSDASAMIVYGVWVKDDLPWGDEYIESWWDRMYPNEPCPVSLVASNAARSDDPILVWNEAVLIHTDWYDPKIVDISQLSHKYRENLLDFCQSCGVEYKSGPDWYIVVHYD